MSEWDMLWFDPSKYDDTDTPEGDPAEGTDDTWSGRLASMRAERDAALQEVERQALLLGAKASEIEAIWIDHQAELEAEVASLRAALQGQTMLAEALQRSVHALQIERDEVRAALREKDGPT